MALRIRSVGTIIAIVLIFAHIEKRNRGRVKEKHDTVEEAPSELQVGPILPILKDKAFVMYTLVIMLYMGSQIICSTWIPVYVETDLMQSPAITATSPHGLSGSGSPSPGC